MIRNLSRLALIATLGSTLIACAGNPKAPVESTDYTPIELTQTARGPMMSLDDVLFDFEESTLRPEALPIIAQAAQYLKTNPSRQAVVEGHTDTTGDEFFNQVLSVERARAVKNALINAGIATSRISTTGLGETQPVADNASREGRQANRRVEIVFEDQSV